MSQRILQINDLIREHLGELFLREISFKAGILVTITKVETSADLRHAKISISTYPEQESEYALKTIFHEKRAIQKALHRKLHMKPLPILSFVSDSTEQDADVVEKLLRRLG